MTKSVHSLRVVCLFAALTVFMGVVAFDAPARSADAQSGYLLGTDAGRIFAFGDFEQRQLVSAEPIVDFTSLSDGSGVVAIDASGHLISAGAVSVPAGVDNSAWAIDEWAVGIVAVPGREGFWAITSAGRVQVVGDAPAIADVSSLDLASPVVAGSATPDGRGLYLIGADGGIFALGTARFLGSVPEVLPGVRLDAPIVGIGRALDEAELFQRPKLPARGRLVDPQAPGNLTDGQRPVAPDRSEHGEARGGHGDARRPQHAVALARAAGAGCDELGELPDADEVVGSVRLGAAVGRIRALVGHAQPCSR